MVVDDAGVDVVVEGTVVVVVDAGVVEVVELGTPVVVVEDVEDEGVADVVVVVDEAGGFSVGSAGGIVKMFGGGTARPFGRAGPSMTAIRLARPSSAATIAPTVTAVGRSPGASGWRAARAASSFARLRE